MGSKLTEAIVGREGTDPVGVDPPVPADLAQEPTAPPEPAVAEAASATADAAAADPRCADATDLARDAAREVAGDSVGDYLGFEVEGERLLTHSFATTQPGYVGWRWAVTVTRADGADEVTVDEVVLLPGSGALVPPAWVPWSERIRPGDLGPGELLPSAPDDPRLTPSYADPDAVWLDDDLHWQLGLGRERVLSREGRADAAWRWYAGAAGPDAPIARAAPARCADCGFLAPLAGSLSQAFGLCANELAPDDGRVVSLDHGCGAHSEVVAEPAHSVTAGMAVEDDELELVTTGAPRATTDDDAEAAEQLGHS